MFCVHSIKLFLKEYLLVQLYRSLTDSVQNSVKFTFVCYKSSLRRWEKDWWNVAGDAVDHYTPPFSRICQDSRQMGQQLHRLLYSFLFCIQICRTLLSLAEQYTSMNTNYKDVSLVIMIFLNFNTKWLLNSIVWQTRTAVLIDIKW
jgi:hypothetical protein